MRPSISASNPITLLSVVVLPAPLRPTSATRPSRGTVRETPRSTSAPAIATRTPCITKLSCMAEHRLAHARIGQHHGRLPIGDDEPLIEHQNAPAVALHDVHVVLHE